MVDTLFALNLFFGAMVAGSMVFELLVLMPTLRSEPAAMLQTMPRLGHREVPFLLTNGLLSLAAAVLILIVGDDLGSATVALLIVGSVVLIFGAVSTGGLYVVRFVQHVRSAPPDPTPEVLADLKGRWLRAQVIRTTFYASGFLCYVVASVVAN
jgi:hypothetical protein